MSKIIDIKCLINQNDGLQSPSGLIFDNQADELYICDMMNNRVVKYNFMAKTLSEMPTIFKDHKAKSIRPLAITMNATGKLIITDTEYNTLFLYAYKKWREINVSRSLKINLPGSVTCCQNGNIYFTDFMHDKICVIHNAANVSVVEGISCKNPYGIYCYKNYLYITDNGNKRILRFDILMGETDVLFEGDISPIAITADEKGDIYFSEIRKIYLFHIKTNKTELIVSRDNWGEYGINRLHHIGALSAASNNRLIFSDTINNCVYEMTLDRESKKSA